MCSALPASEDRQYALNVWRMANNNKNLGAAKTNKKDEFYTQLPDIENELRHYTRHFRGKVVLCNCDDPYESNFFKYFALNFNRLGLKKLICTCFDGSPIAGGELPLVFEVDSEGNEKKFAYKVELTSVTDVNGDGATDLLDVMEILRNNPPTLLKQHGDFRSNECIEILKEADIVVTNPPFSLFREYVAQLMKYEKKFVIIGNVNAITYKEIFPLIKEDKMWIGPSIHNGDRKFTVPEYYPLNAAGCGVDNDGKRYIRVKGVRWFTNIDFKQRHDEIVLYKHYNDEEFPRYDNYDAINVNTTADIPYDYEGVMGVPITFLDKYNPSQFEIVGASNFDDTPCRIERNYKALGYKFYKSDGVTESGSGALRDRTSPKVYGKGKGDFSVSPDGAYLSATYFRIFIRRKS